MALMRRQFHALRIAGALLLLLGASITLLFFCGQAGAENSGERLNVGSTGVMCIRRPCPDRGIYRPGAKDLQTLERSLLYADLDGKTGLPRIEGAAADVARINGSWEQGKCLAIVGRFAGNAGNRTLHVSRVVGQCR